jgi:hypothetical protein
MPCDYPKKEDVAFKLSYLRQMLRGNIESGKYDEAKEVNDELCTISYCDGSYHHRIVSNGDMSNTMVGSVCPHDEARLLENDMVTERKRPGREWQAEKKRIEEEMGGI